MLESLVRNSRLNEYISVQCQNTYMECLGMFALQKKERSYLFLYLELNLNTFSVLL